MTEQATSFVQEGVDRFNAARERVDEEFQRVQKQLQARRKRIERQLDTSRKNLEKQTRKQVKQVRAELSRNPVLKRLERIGTEASRQFEGALESVFDVFQLASKNDVQKIDRKLSKINKRLKEIERARTTNGQQQPPASL